ncbi:MAG: hypothetical protein CM1200mP27_12810 [Chloroflexota bacterium]|nr:MAG: hypothetical protein CM1200mP27_12810 [Chloroflexota bacterium]
MARLPRKCLNSKDGYHRIRPNRPKARPATILDEQGRQGRMQRYETDFADPKFKRVFPV